jgi:ferritin-like metal-binding protein YciE
MERAQVNELRTLASSCLVPSIAALLRAHLEETRDHGDRVEARLEELGAGGSVVHLAQAFGVSIPKVLVDRLRTNDSCAVLRDAVFAEAFEVASYVLLEGEAIHAGDESTEVLAAEIRGNEAATLDELMTYWQQAVDDQVFGAKERSGERSRTRVARELLVDQLQDMQALARNATLMFTSVLATIDDPLASARVADHRDATYRYGEALVQRLRELGSRPSLRKQAQGFAFAAVKGPVNLVRSERAAKDLRDMYVVEHMELAGYAQLAALAELCGDDVTLQIARSHGGETQAMVAWLERDAGRFLLESLAASR